MLEEKLRKYATLFHPVVPFEWEKDKLWLFDFTDRNEELTAEQIANTDQFANYINSKLKENGCRYGIGGYNEHRTLYARSKHYDKVHSSFQAQSHLMDWVEEETPAEPRRLHLGIDIWGPAGTAVMAPMDGLVHSFAFNNNDSDYGSTIILTHILDGISFHTLYGHLSLNSLKNLHEGKNIRRGDVFTEFGMRFENGNWPPHLHFQLIKDMQGWEGDYPGVCKYSERDQWLSNCPDPDLVLQMSRESLVGSR